VGAVSGCSVVGLGLSAAALVGALFSAACTAPLPPPSPVAGNDGGATNDAGGAGSICAADTPLPQRLVRLDFAKVASGVAAVLGPTALVNLDLPGKAGNPRAREFQALFVEGDFINTDVLTDTVTMTEGALANVSTDDFAKLSDCAAPQTDACVTAYLERAAERGYRRPLLEEETAALLGLYQTLRDAGNTPEAAARSCLEAILIAPQALYRSELGEPAGDAFKLTAFEAASALSYFLQDGPPDDELYAVAAAGSLLESEVWDAQVERLLSSTQVVENMNQIVGAYFGVGEIDSIVKDPAAFPDWNVAVANSMYAETDFFIRNQLWRGDVGALLTSQDTYVNSVLADLYGYSYPADVSDPENSFVAILSDPQRAGILTQGSVLSIRSRTNDTSVVSRGLWVNGRILCSQAPPSPPASVLAAVEAQSSDMTQTEREKSNYRTTTAQCQGCHANFDAYGLAVESFDGIGRYRAEYSNGEPIDTSTKLPDAAGGGDVKDALELARAVAESGTFTRCMASNFTKYARAEAQATTTVDDCQVAEIHQRFAESDQSFKSLLSAIARSVVLGGRAGGSP